MTNKFSIFLKTGGGEKASSLNPLIKSVSSIFDELSKGAYVNPDIQFHIEFRVDGDVYTFDDHEGCSNLKFLKKKNVIANTVAIKEENLKAGEKVKDLALKYISVSVEQMADRLIKEKYAVQKEKLMTDLNTKLNNI